MSYRRLEQHVPRACIFAGPSLSGHMSQDAIDIYPPASRGAVTGAADAGYSVIGIIDGTLEPSDRVPLAELSGILERPGTVLLGGASMGAIRAAQLEAAGMRGVGRVFRLLRRRTLSDSNEVFVLHAPEGLRYRPLTIPLVNVRFTVRRLRRAGYITMPEEQALTAHMADVPWFDRDRQALAAAAYRTCGPSRSGHVIQAFDRLYRDVKQEDALAVCGEIQQHIQSLERSPSIGRVGIHPFGL